MDGVFLYVKRNFNARKLVNGAKNAPFTRRAKSKEIAGTMVFKKKIYAVILILAIFGLAFYVGLVARIYSYANINEARKADAVVVMGASQWNGKPSPVFQARLDHAFSLYQAGFSSKFILTGGVGNGERLAESEVGKDYLIEKSVPGQKIFREEVGQTSLQSLKQVAQILEQQKMDSIILVSDGFHMMRLEKMAEDLGIEAYISATQGYMSNLAEFKYIMRESLVYLLCLLFKV